MTDAGQIRWERNYYKTLRERGGHTLREIGEAAGLTKQRISALLKDEREDGTR